MVVKIVALLTTVSVVLSGIASVPELMHIMPPRVAALIALANAVVTAILGVAAHRKVNRMLREGSRSNNPTYLGNLGKPGGNRL